jgi:hypothetical protein
MAEKSELAFKVNLSNLKRLDPHVVDIVDRAAHVVVYIHAENEQTWVR